MKIFFMASPRGNIQDCKIIHKTILDLGHIHTTDFVITINPTSFYKVNEEIWGQRYQERLKQISDADICVFEASIPSLAIGQLFQEAVREEKPVIALYASGTKPHTLLGTQGNERKVQVIEYSKDSLKKVLKYSLEIAEELLTTRFTMLMPSDLSGYLEKKGKTIGLSRSEYIRHLIKQDMERE